MEPYNFWQDFFEAYRQSPDWIKLVWVVVPPGFVLGLIALILRFFSRLEDAPIRGAWRMERMYPRPQAPDESDFPAASAPRQITHASHEKDG
ncbi:MAG: hypothetical protein KDJ80_05045 [Nitratireductor sp.]|nr:hypothetical protein [Nitratireductor sp.]